MNTHKALITGATEADDALAIKAVKEGDRVTLEGAVIYVNKERSEVTIKFGVFNHAIPIAAIKSIERIEPKACPFCACRLVPDSTPHSWMHPYNGCYAEGDYVRVTDAASDDSIDRWNHRATPPGDES